MKQNGEKKPDTAFSANLKALRSEHKVTQSQIALVLGIDRSTYAYYETGKCEPTLTTLIRIADYFQVSLDQLVGRGKF